MTVSSEVTIGTMAAPWTFCPNRTYAFAVRVGRASWACFHVLLCVTSLSQNPFQIDRQCFLVRMAGRLPRRGIGAACVIRLDTADRWRSLDIHVPAASCVVTYLRAPVRPRFLVGGAAGAACSARAKPRSKSANIPTALAVALALGRVAAKSGSPKRSSKPNARGVWRRGT